GQGVNMVIEDAISLAMCLEKYNFQMEPAFQEYYKKRFNRTKRVVDMARYMGSFYRSENPIISSIRRHVYPRIFLSRTMLKRLEKEIFENCPVPVQQKNIVK
ncbi:unnamed protein product, partial [Rotaria sp. Silwood1]